MVLPLIAAGISAGAGLIGGSMASDAAAEQAEKNRQMQIQFAKEGIRWKVADAKAAGIHPLYALGANTVSYAPVSVGTSSMGSAVASAGQDISRALNATSTASERQNTFSEAASKLQLDNMSLQNQLLASRIATINQGGGNPPIPEIGPLPPVPEAKKQEDRPPLQIGGERINTDPGTSSMRAFEDRYGDEGPISWYYSAAVQFEDLKRNYGQPATWPNQVMRAAWNTISHEAKSEYGNFERFVNIMRSTKLPGTGASGGW